MATSGKAIFFNALVVICGFLVFVTSNFRPNFYLGVMLALNMSACLLVSMTVLPVVLNTFKPRFVYGREVAPAGVPVAAD
jgi:predicted RND superfamily exporter protein